MMTLGRGGCVARPLADRPSEIRAPEMIRTDTRAVVRTSAVGRGAGVAIDAAASNASSMRFA